VSERFSYMGKVLRFKARKRVRKGKPIPEREIAGKVIEFHKPKSIHDSENAGARKSDEAIAQAMFFWSF
jgi:hypothetical protein